MGADLVVVRETLNFKQMNTKKGKNKGGGTPKGVSKPHRRMTKETSGVAMPGADAFSDVGRACRRFLLGRVAMGAMHEKEASPHFGKKIQNSKFKTQRI